MLVLSVSGTKMNRRDSARFGTENHSLELVLPFISCAILGILFNLIIF
jgi:hypothetical protein